MRNPNPEIVEQIKQKAHELLIQKNPEEIGMRDIASACNITATNIYHYFKDKYQLFSAVSLDCLYKLNELITESSKKGKNIKNQIKNAVSAYRDWCFENPRQAILIMHEIKCAEDIPPEVIEEYYVCNRTGEKLLKEAVKQGLAKSGNPRMDVSLLVFGLWGCIESVLYKKCEVEYLEKGIEYTDRFIKMWLDSIFIK